MYYHCINKIPTVTDLLLLDLNKLQLEILSSYDTHSKRQLLSYINASELRKLYQNNQKN